MKDNQNFEDFRLLKNLSDYSTGNPVGLNNGGIIGRGLGATRHTNANDK